MDLSLFRLILYAIDTHFIDFSLYNSSLTYCTSSLGLSCILLDNRGSDFEFDLMKPDTIDRERIFGELTTTTHFIES